MLKKCPYCGRELPQPRRRLPSGFGQISEIRNKNLAKPFRAMITVGRKENGRPICKLLRPVAYFETYEEAYAALEEYHARMGSTMRELFDMWFKEKRPEIRHPELVRSDWSRCSSIWHIGVRDVRNAELRVCVQQENITPSEKARIAFLFRRLFDYARECGILGEEK